jgi:hypothetical protein
VIGQVPGPVHQWRDSLLAWPLGGREVADCGLFTHFEMITFCDWSGSGACPPIAGQFTHVASQRTRGADCELFTHFEMLTLSLIGQVPGPVHQLRDSVLAWPLGGREVAGPGPSQPVEVTSGAGPHQPTSCQVQICPLQRVNSDLDWFKNCSLIYLPYQS